MANDSIDTMSISTVSGQPFTVRSEKFVIVRDLCGKVIKIEGHTKGIKLGFAFREPLLIGTVHQKDNSINLGEVVSP